jgi:hypothetical protein
VSETAPYDTTTDQIVRSDLYALTLDGTAKLKTFNSLEEAERFAASIIAKDLDRTVLIYKLHGQYKSVVPPMDVTYFFEDAK